MAHFIFNRAVQALLNILFIATTIFMLVRLTGDPAEIYLPDMYRPEAIERIHKRLGLDKPLYQQYFIFIKSLAQGDLGTSYVQDRAVSSMLKEALPATATLALAAITIALVIALPLGVLSAVYRDTFIDKIGKIFALLGQATPAFWLGIMLILALGVQIQIFPVAQRGGLMSYVLPGFTMGWVVVAGIMRLTRSSMLDVLDSDYILMARAKGLPGVVVVWKHALRNALIPVITYLGLIVGGFMNGAVVVERVFAWPGVGSMALEAVFSRDFPVVQAMVMMMGAFFILINLFVDIVYAYVDPRIKYS